ncbi:hypothetical protein [Rhizobium sp. NFR03]|uniref:hypothetical protein n=1 Tax=Rhizobium sp. NFR03 TaxID=1566263 RepID=UPI0008CC9D8F|nr:hypothetical protein [Rhizobium sp. NFR03]SES38036.1 hypothetical protein SAMN03159406_03848 [Rhizobium sp. NFR03]
MKTLLPELHQGHAPITLHQLFREAIDAYEEWNGGVDTPTIYYQGALLPIALIFDHMRGCTDILPSSVREVVTSQLTKPWSSESPLDDMTVSTAARIMGIMIRKRQVRSGRADINAFIRRMERRQAHRLVRA